MLLAVQVHSQLSEIKVFKVERVFTEASVEGVVVHTPHNNTGG